MPAGHVCDEFVVQETANKRRPSQQWAKIDRDTDPVPYLLARDERLE